MYVKETFQEDKYKNRGNLLSQSFPFFLYSTWRNWCNTLAIRYYFKWKKEKNNLSQESDMKTSVKLGEETFFGVSILAPLRCKTRQDCRCANRSTPHNDWSISSDRLTDPPEEANRETIRRCNWTYWKQSALLSFSVFTRSVSCWPALHHRESNWHWRKLFSLTVGCQSEKSSKYNRQTTARQTKSRWVIETEICSSLVLVVVFRGKVETADWRMSDTNTCQKKSSSFRFTDKQRMNSARTHIDHLHKLNVAQDRSSLASSRLQPGGESTRTVFALDFGSCWL